MRDAAGELDHLQAALDVALGVGDDLAVLAGKDLGQFVDPAFDQSLEFEHHPRAALRIGRRPADLGPGGGLNGGVEFVGGGEGDARLNLPGIGIEDVAEATGGPVDGRSVHEMLNLAHAHSTRQEKIRGACFPL